MNIENILISASSPTALDILEFFLAFWNTPDSFFDSISGHLIVLAFAIFKIAIFLPLSTVFAKSMFTLVLKDVIVITFISLFLLLKSAAFSW